MRSVCLALYSPSIRYSIAVNFPKAGEINLIIHPEIKYHPNIIPGPSHPTVSASFLENKIISRIGLQIFKYKLEREVAHFSASYVSL
jgi:hypothetical protein